MRLCRRLTALSVLLLSTLAAMTPALAAINHFEFSGPLPGGSLGSPGDLTGHISYDTAAAPPDAVLSMSFSAGGLDWHLAPMPASLASLEGITVINAVPNDQVIFNMGAAGPDVMQGMDTWRPSHLLVRFRGDPTLLSSTAIPTFAQLAGFTDNFAALQFEKLDASGAGTGIRSPLAFTFALAITAAVPEPQTYALLLAGLGLLGFAARRRIRAVPIPRA